MGMIRERSRSENEAVLCLVLFPESFAESVLARSTIDTPKFYDKMLFEYLKMIDTGLNKLPGGQRSSKRLQKLLFRPPKSVTPLL